MQSSEAEFTHRTVLADETTAFVLDLPDGAVIDATLGLGGHSETVLERTERNVIGIDQDQAAIGSASQRLERFGKRFETVHANFSDIAKIAEGRKVAAVIADLGVSSMQLDDASRGFSFRFDAPLDMRMDRSAGETAADLLATLSETDLADVIYRFGEERRSRRIARFVAERNKAGDPIETTADLASLVERAVGRKPSDKIHPATRTFQALRIAVNREIDILEDFLRDAVEVLEPEGVLAVITFHSLEDRIVKHTFRLLAGQCTCPPRIPKCVCGAKKEVEILTRKPIIPTEDEQRSNPRSRSAKLRAARKVRRES